MVPLITTDSLVLDVLGDPSFGVIQVSTRNVTFTFAPDPATIDLLASFQLALFNPNGTQFTAVTLAKTVTTFSAGLPVGAGYKATLKALSATGVADANPPSVTFDVPAPPPTVPGDPTLNPPTIS